MVSFYNDSIVTIVSLMTFSADEILDNWLWLICVFGLKSVSEHTLCLVGQLCLQEHIGGATELISEIKSGRFQERLKAANIPF